MAANKVLNFSSLEVFSGKSSTSVVATDILRNCARKEIQYFVFAILRVALC